MGYNEYFVRSFWEAFEKLEYFKIPVYRFSDIEFDLLFIYRRETLVHLRDECIPIEEIVCHRHRLDCIKAPHTNALYIYIEGDYRGRVFVRTNILRVLRLLNIWRSEEPYRLIEMVRRALRGEVERDEIIRHILNLLRSRRDILHFILPKIPGDSEELLMFSPILRILHYLRRK